jgi:predicted MFS family arabinose efflux permease
MTIKNAPTGTIRAALRYRGFRWLLAALAVSQLGDWLYNLALVVLVYDRTHSPLWAGVTTAARIVPMLVLGPLGGIVADRWDRRRLMIGCDLARMAMMLLLALVAAARLPIVLAPLIAALATVAAAPYMPCTSAITPRVVDDADLPGANAARTATVGLGIVGGPALGGLLLLLGSPALAFVVNGLTFGFSALCIPAIGGAAVFRSVRQPGHPAGLRHDLAAGASALRANPAAIRVIGADVMCSLLYGTQTVLLLAVARRVGLGTGGYGYLFASMGAGGLIGTALAGRAARFRDTRYVLAAALAAVGLPMPLLAVIRWPALALIVVALGGVGALLVEITMETCLQRTLDEEVFGRAYGLAIPVSLGGIAAGSLIGPLLSRALGVPGALIIVGGAVLGYAALLLRGQRTAQAPVPQAVAAVE